MDITLKKSSVGTLFIFCISAMSKLADKQVTSVSDDEFVRCRSSVVPLSFS